MKKIQSSPNSHGTLTFEFDDSQLKNALASDFRDFFERSGMPESEAREELVKKCVHLASLFEEIIAAYLELARESLTLLIFYQVVDIALLLRDDFPPPDCLRQYANAHTRLWREFIFHERADHPRGGRPRGAHDPRADHALLAQIIEDVVEQMAVNPDKVPKRSRTAKNLTKKLEKLNSKIADSRKIDDRRIETLLLRTAPIRNWKNLVGRVRREIKSTSKSKAAGQK